EGNWETRANAPLLLFAIPDADAEQNTFEIGIPGLASLILQHDFAGEIAGLKDFPRDERPPVGWVFYSFRVMLLMGVLMLALAWIGLVQLRRGRLEHTRWLLHAFRWSAPAGLVAVIAGWFTTEIGRQPYLVYGLMRTADGISPVPGGSVATTLALFVLVYGF